MAATMSGPLFLDRALLTTSLTSFIAAGLTEDAKFCTGLQECLPSMIEGMAKFTHPKFCCSFFIGQYAHEK